MVAWALWQAGNWARLIEWLNCHGWTCTPTEESVVCERLGVVLDIPRPISPDWFDRMAHISCTLRALHGEAVHDELAKDDLVWSWKAVAFNGRSKWWHVEARFDRRITRAQARRVAASLDPLLSSCIVVGVDGLRAEPWPGSWPGRNEWGRMIRGLSVPGVPFRLRVAPRGRDCDETCEGFPCATDSNVVSCPPVWRDADWVEFGGE